MKVTVALAALAAVASATTELQGRQAGHNDKPCKKRPDVTSVCPRNHYFEERVANNYTEEARS
jgi:hypothetical protein